MTRTTYNETRLLKKAIRNKLSGEWIGIILDRSSEYELEANKILHENDFREDRIQTIGGSRNKIYIKS